MATDISNFSDSLAAAVEQFAPRVVRIEARRRRPSSGFLWDEGLVITAAHTLERDEGIVLGLTDGRELSATLVGSDAATDVALLKADVPASPPPRALLEHAKVGHGVLSLARPGRSVRATFGIVSAVGEAWRTPLGGEVDRYLESDLFLAPGFDGGPMIDVSGRLVGLSTSAFTRRGTGIIPWNTLERLVSAFKAHGTLRRGYLGVGAHAIRLPPQLAAQEHQSSALLLLSVEPGGPADKAGLSFGDTLLSLGGTPLRDVDELLAALAPERVGSAQPLAFLRGGARHEVSVTPGERR